MPVELDYSAATLFYENADVEDLKSFVYDR